MKNIPDFEPLFDEVVAFVREHQGEKGYIDTQNPRLDTIYTFNFDGNGDAYEAKVHGVRVKDYDDGYDLEVITEPIMRTYTVEYGDEDFRAEDAEWESVRWGEIPYVHTLLSIAESIEEYV